MNRFICSKFISYLIVNQFVYVFLIQVPLAPTDINVTERSTDSLLFGWSHDGLCTYYLAVVASSAQVQSCEALYPDRQCQIINLPTAGLQYDIIVMAVTEIKIEDTINRLTNVSNRSLARTGLRSYFIKFFYDIGYDASFLGVLL